MNSKLVASAVKSILFVYFAVFPFGQLARVDVNIFGQSVPLVAIDVLGIALFALTIFDKKKPEIWVYFRALFFVFLFSYMISVASNQLPVISAGSFYLTRLLGILGVFFAVYSLVRKKLLGRELVINALFVCSVAIAVFGWVQYFWLPNFRAFRVWGWDDHLYRLVGTHLDPGFTSILLVFGFIVSFAGYLRHKTQYLLWITIFLFISILFTYSRAGYLALVVGAGYLLRKRPWLIVLSLLFLVLGVVLLPKPYGEGVNLARTASVEARVENYRQTFEIFKTSPLFGIGYNNLCLVKQKVFSIEFSVHSCGGSDSSALLILATTGVVGLISFVVVARKMFQVIPGGLYKDIFIASSLALLAHSQFVGSLFYPWVLGWLLITYALTLKC